MTYMNNTTNPTTSNTNLTLARTVQGDWHVHSVGCADLSKGGKYPKADQFKLVVEAGASISLAAAEDIYCDIATDSCSTDEEFAAYFEAARHEFHILPCAEKAHSAKTDNAAAWAPRTDAEIEAEVAAAREAEAEVEIPAPGTPAAAQAELDRRKANRAGVPAGSVGEWVRIEAASDWAFQAGSAELKALAAQA